MWKQNWNSLRILLTWMQELEVVTDAVDVDIELELDMELELVTDVVDVEVELECVTEADEV